MSEQKHFDFPRASKLRALERVVCSANVKALLRALDSFARDERTCTVTQRAIGVSMSVSPKTVQRTIKAAEAEGLVIKYGESADGRSNTYRINWQAVFNLPDGLSGAEQTGTGTTPVKQRANPGQIDRGPRSGCPTPPVRLTGDPGQVDRGPRSLVTGVCPTVSYDSLAAERLETRQRSDGGGEMRTTEDKPASGWWIGRIDLKELCSPVFIVSLYQQAARNKIIAHKPDNQVRITAICLQAAKDPEIAKMDSISGWMIKTIEGGIWSRLTWSYLKEAERKSGIMLTDEQRVTLRDNDGQECPSYNGQRTTDQ